MCLSRILFHFLLLFPFSLAGCGGDTTESTGKGETVQTPKTVEPIRIAGDRIQFEKDQIVSNLDDQRLDVKPPKGWSLGPRQEKYLVWFRVNKAAQVPRLLVSLEEPSEGFENVNEKNVVAFAKAIQKEVDNEKVKLIEKDVLPIIAGDQPCARYVVGGKLGGASVDRQVLITQANGRRYRVELQSYTDSFKEHRDAGYSVMAGLTFRTKENDADKEGD